LTDFNPHERNRDARHGMVLDPDRDPKSARLAIGIVVVALALFLVASSMPSVGSIVGPDALTLTILSKRTGPNEASALGTVENTPTPGGNLVELLVNGAVVRSTTSYGSGEYWFTKVPVSDGATIQTRVGSIYSASEPVPAYVAQPVGLPGFIYAQGTHLMKDGQPIILFGINEATAFSWAIVASATPDPTVWGLNNVFPNGPGSKIPNVANADQFWREYFRYILHNRPVGDPNNPPVTLLRIWIVDNNWQMEMTYNYWKANPAGFWNLFDRMVYWAARSNTYLVPILGQNAIPPNNLMYDTTNPLYLHNLELTRAIVQRYDGSPTIAMWDLWNEADSYWSQIGDINTFRTWVGHLISDVEPYSPHHLITVGSANNQFIAGSPGWGWRLYFDFNDIPGLQVANQHMYEPYIDQTYIDINSDWNDALGTPHFQSEYGYWQCPSPVGNPLCYGYWPYYTERRMTRGVGALAPMVFLDNGKGAYYDYPYTGTLPSYPPVASFVFSPANPIAGNAVSFDGSASYNDAGPPVATYQWNFGDGGTGSGKTIPHTYASGGNFTATLTVTDTSGGSGTSSQTVPVQSSSPGPDTTPPARTTDLRATGTGYDYAVLAWTAPGDDGNVGTATTYSVRYSTTGPLTDSNFLTGTAVPVPAPHPAGSKETLNVTGLAQGTTYWFGLRTADEVPNWSPVSTNANVTTKSTQVSVVSPAAGAILPTASVLLKWSVSSPAPNSTQVQIDNGPWIDAGTGTSYLFTGVADGPRALRVHVMFGSTGLYASTNALVDTQSPAVTILSPRSGDILQSSTIIVDWTATDSGSGIAAVAVRQDAQPYRVVQGNSTTFRNVVAGSHTFSVQGTDNAGHIAEASVVVTVTAVGGSGPTVSSVVFQSETKSIDLTFSEPMNETSVENSIGIAPTVSYSLAWVNASYLRIVVVGPMEQGTLYQVTIQNSAQGTGGNRMASAYAFWFEAPRPGAGIDVSFLWSYWFYLLFLLVTANWVLATFVIVRCRRRAARARKSHARLTRGFERSMPIR